MIIKNPKTNKLCQFSNDSFHNYLTHEEIANTITHGIGFLLGVAALVLMVVKAANHAKAIVIVSVAIFGASLIISYLSSMLYHLFRRPAVKQVFKILDHSCIYLLIAGTYTPFVLVTLHGAFGWTVFGVIWGMAIAGICFKAVFVDKFLFVSTIIYILMGWFIVAAIVPIIHDLPMMGFLWLLIGGLAYTLGTIFFALERFPFFHTIWHIFVLAGSICQFFAVLFYVIS